MWADHEGFVRDTDASIVAWEMVNPRGSGVEEGMARYGVVNSKWTPEL